MNEITHEEMNLQLIAMAERARAAAVELALLTPETKTKCLNAMADALIEQQDKITAANAVDMENGRNNGLSKAMLDRLEMTPARIQAMAAGLREVGAQEDPVGRVIRSFSRPNGIKIEKVSVPVGVIAIIYESRPNVTADAAGICLKAGNAVILRGGKESINSNLAIASILERAGSANGLPADAIQLIPWTDRAAVGMMLKLDSLIDLVMPRGGESLIRAVVEQSRIPVIKHYKGVCHVYVDKAADLEMACNIVENAKCSRPGVCNALESLLVNRAVAGKFLPLLASRLAKYPVEMRGDSEVCNILPEAVPLTPDDNGREYLDLVMGVRLVGDTAEAVKIINTMGSHHSDSIVTEDETAAAVFLRSVDSAAVYHNASTRFTDGGEFGMGAEIGISTDKLHARGPMGVDELVIYKYIIRGCGQVR